MLVEKGRRKKKEKVKDKEAYRLEKNAEVETALGTLNLDDSLNKRLSLGL